uniref:Uncharacterized protein n=1 Tax=Oryza meridionalis TaxID=40149 RepID=A0A0E0E933_9ORYZ
MGVASQASAMTTAASGGWPCQRAASLPCAIVVVGMSPHVPDHRLRRHHRRVHVEGAKASQAWTEAKVEAKLGDEHAAAIHGSSHSPSLLDATPFPWEVLLSRFDIHITWKMGAVAAEWKG